MLDAGFEGGSGDTGGVGGGGFETEVDLAGCVEGGIGLDAVA